jgi:heme exporter protein D
MNPYIRPEDGPLMRRYLNWAQPYYEKFSPERRNEAVLLDRWLYSKRSLGFLIGLLATAVALFLGLRAAGMRTSLALIATGCALVLSFYAIGSTWWFGDLNVSQPKWLRKNPWLSSFYLSGMAYLGALVGFTTEHFVYTAEPVSLAGIRSQLLDALAITGPAAVAFTAMLVGLVSMTLVFKKQYLQGVIQQLQAEAAIQKNHNALTEAKLRLLNAQIKPHFLFNTLAALQHWTETGDSRAPALIRNLTGFLRKSADIMDKRLVNLDEEIQLITEYLAIMKLRFNDKLVVEFQVEEKAKQVLIPPALLLTLVENALEHGIEPSLHGGLVRIDARVDDHCLTVDVTNSGLTLPDDFVEGVGLTNSRQRISGIFNDRASLTLEPDKLNSQTRARFVCPNKGVSIDH